MNYRIWVSYHQDEQIALFDLKSDDHHVLYPTHRNVEGRSINELNPVYSEMVTMWHVWQNDVKSDVVGFEHYRRHLHVTTVPKKGECQVLSIRNFGSQTLYEQYAQWHNRRDMDLLLEILDERYGKDNAYGRHIRVGHTLIANCTFLMRWTDFVKMCEYLFPLLEEFGRRCGMTDGLGTLEEWTRKAERDFAGRKTIYQRRVVSFLAERLISAWIDKHLKWWNGITAAIVHYNTPELTAAAIRSLEKHTPGCKVVVFDNSDQQPFEVGDCCGTANITVIDNTKSQVIDFEALLAQYPDKEQTDVRKSNFGSTKHAASVDKLMEILPDGFVLMDSDVLITKNIRPLIDRTVAAVGTEQIKDGIPLLQPFLCWLNVPILREHGISYFDGQHMWALTPGNRWDTGAWLLHQIRKLRLPWKAVNIWEYVIHLGHGSWRDREAKVWLEKNKELWK